MQYRIWDVFKGIQVRDRLLLLPPSPFIWTRPLPLPRNQRSSHYFLVFRSSPLISQPLLQQSPPNIMRLLRLAVVVFIAVLQAVAISQLRNAVKNPELSEPTTVDANAFNPDEVASAQDWAAAVSKGDRFLCRLVATDEGAGRLWEDTRNPPSARSEWADATLRTEFALWGWHEGDWDQLLTCDFRDVGSQGTIRIGKQNPH